MLVSRSGTAFAAAILVEELDVAARAGADIRRAIDYLPTAAEWIKFPRSRWPRPRDPWDQLAYAVALACRRVAAYTLTDETAVEKVRTALIVQRSPKAAA